MFFGYSASSIMKLTHKACEDKQCIQTGMNNLTLKVSAIRLISIVVFVTNENNSFLINMKAFLSFL